MIVAINQPCYLPWRGFFALMKAADVFVFYDDVQFTSNTSRSFFARVQLKTAAGRRWLTRAGAQERTLRPAHRRDGDR